MRKFSVFFLLPIAALFGQIKLSIDQDRLYISSKMDFGESPSDVKHWKWLDAWNSCSENQSQKTHEPDLVSSAGEIHFKILNDDGDHILWNSVVLKGLPEAKKISLSMPINDFIMSSNDVRVESDHDFGSISDEFRTVANRPCKNLVLHYRSIYRFQITEQIEIEEGGKKILVERVLSQGSKRLMQPFSAKIAGPSVMLMCLVFYLGIIVR